MGRCAELDDPNFKRIKITWIVDLPKSEVDVIMNFLSRYLHTKEVTAEEV